MDKVVSRRVERVLLCLVLSAASGCHASLVAIRDQDMPAATVRASAVTLGIRDRREAFAAFFCREAATHTTPGDGARTCRGWLRLPPSAAAQPQVLAASSGPRPIVIIPGIFGECVARSATPFSDAYAPLRARGHRVDVLAVDGRSSSAKNGRAIDAWMEAHASQLDGAIVVAYSKGATDFMHAAVLDAGKRHWRDRIGALVTIAGVVNGTPLASRGEGAYAKLLARLKVPACGPGDGGGVSSLTYREASAARDAYLASGPAPRTLAVVAVTAPGAVNPVLAPFHQQLRQLDERNDGQVLTEDAVLPGSELIAAAAADHWSITLPFETSGPDVRMLSRNNHFPRVPMMLGIVGYLDATPTENRP